MNSKCAEAGPALGSVVLAKIVELSGSLSHPSWFPGPKVMNPVRVAFHSASCSAEKVALIRMLSKVLFELAVHCEVASGWSYENRYNEAVECTRQ